MAQSRDEIQEMWGKRYPDKFAAEERIFFHIHRGGRIFISTACGEPQYLVNSLVRYAESNPKAIVDAELMHVWTLDAALIQTSTPDRNGYVSLGISVDICMGQMIKDERGHTAEVAFAVRDDMQNRGIGSELLDYLILQAKREGLLGFTAEVLVENRPMLHVFEKMFPGIEKKLEDGVFELVLRFSDGRV